jgi:hypothetical protein
MDWFKRKSPKPSPSQAHHGIPTVKFNPSRVTDTTVEDRELKKIDDEIVIVVTGTVLIEVDGVWSSCMARASCSLAGIVISLAMPANRKVPIIAQWARPRRFEYDGAEAEAWMNPSRASPRVCIGTGMNAWRRNRAQLKSVPML